MALLQQLLLGLPPTLHPHHPHLSLPLSNPPLHLSLPRFTAQISDTRRRRSWGTTALNRLSSVSPLSSSSTTEAAAEAETETEEATTEDKESEESPARPRNRLIAQNIPWNSTAEEIKSLFEAYGTVVDVELAMYNKTRNRGLAFITMASAEEALVALNSLNSYVNTSGQEMLADNIVFFLVQELDGRVINVDFSKSLKKIPNTTAIPEKQYGVFVGNLAWSVRSRNLRELFNTIGNVLSVDVIFESKPRRSAGYGFVSFSSKEEADAAIATFNGKEFMGREIRVILKDNRKGASGGKSNKSEQAGEESNEGTSGEDLSKTAIEDS